MSESKKYSIEVILGVFLAIIILCYGGFELFMYNVSKSELGELGDSAHDKKDILKAKLFYRLSVRKGSIRAMRALGGLYHEQKDIPSAIYWYKKAGNAGESCGFGYIGDIYSEQKKYPEAFKWYKKAGDAGESSGYSEIGNIYKEQNNYSEAIKWYKKALSQGRPYNFILAYDITTLEKKLAEQKNQK